MKYDQKTFMTRNNQKIVLRNAIDSDATALIDYLLMTSTETNFLIRTPNECKISEAKEVIFIRASNRNENDLFLVCTLNDKIIGTCNLRMNPRAKTKHRAEVGIALIKEAWGLGIGTIMFQEMIKIAKDRGVTQLELDFIDGNERAEALYKKIGFVRAARKPNAIRQLDGSFVDEIFMVKTL